MRAELPETMEIPSQVSDSSIAGEPVNAETKRQIEVGLLTGGQDRPYALGLAAALVSKGIRVDFIGSDQLDSPELHTTPKLRFLNLRGSTSPDASIAEKTRRVLLYYARLIAYAATARPRIFHILWNNRFEYFDRTFLMIFFRLLGKKIVLTAHNVNASRRDGTDSLLNRITLKFQYRLCSQIFVHTEKMKAELTSEFRIASNHVSVIPFGINNTVPNTDLTSTQARMRLGISENSRVLLFFGWIGPYKGLEFLAEAFLNLADSDPLYRLVVVGSPKEGCEEYVSAILGTIRDSKHRDRVVAKVEFVPFDDTEVYFKAADLSILPYTDISQSGVLLLAYNFGIPVIATDVGSFSEDVVEGSTGFLCKPRDSRSLGRAIERYFESDLFKNPSRRTAQIREHARLRYSWMSSETSPKEFTVRSCVFMAPMSSSVLFCTGRN